ncbi:MAG: DNA primase small subunit PriS [Promethearchaeota archaeon]|nr:MAG: DNA primase small subunit PriS [Candidatus Lokiarchaeota archaeon]
MQNHKFLQRIFQAYYKEKKDSIPAVSSISNREFAFIPWNKEIMMRHIGFEDLPSLKQYIIKLGPRHMYSSGALYETPEHTNMDQKGFRGCDLIVDIDVDHFYTPCKTDHDIWTCKECQSSGKGMISKCSQCGSLKLSTLNWICKECLNIAKNEIIKLIYKFLVPDFNINLEKIHIAFSGHRGYHLKLEDEKIRTLTSNERRELADYLTGNNISFEILGFQQIQSNIYGFTGNSFDWSRKIVNKIKEILMQYSDDQITDLLTQLGISQNAIKSFIDSREHFLYTITSESHNIWNIEHFGIKTWKKFLEGIVKQVGVEIDEPVIIDIHRLIRYPGSLHGKTGFKVQELSLSQLDEFLPLNENDDALNPIIFESQKNMQKIKINAPEVPRTQIKGESYGPYVRDEIIEVPNHIAIFLICKEVATLV